MGRLSLRLVALGYLTLILIGPLAMGKHLLPRQPLAGVRSPEEVRKIAATLD